MNTRWKDKLTLEELSKMALRPVSPYYYKGVLRRVIDGDTIVADIDLGFDVALKKQNFRLYGINTPE